MVSLKFNNNKDANHIEKSIRILHNILQKRRTFKWIKRALIIELGYHNQSEEDLDSKTVKSSGKEDLDFYFFWFDEDGRFKSMLLFRLLWNLGYSNVDGFIEKTHPAVYSDEEMKDILKTPYVRPEKL
jgi:hypothetical protein